jgi:ABC-2 type transport system ATP-binding protein
MIRIEQLSKQFAGISAVDQLSFEVAAGEVLGFLGPNGAGKSTTMKMITGFLKPTSGTITVLGIDVLQDPLAAQRLIGYLPEGAPLYGEMTVSAYLNFIADARALKGEYRTQRLTTVAAQVEIADVLHKRIDTLSKGFARRVGLAQALLHDPKVLILDEPTDGLDPNQKHQVRELIRQIAHDKIVIISTHILEEVSAVCSRAIIINHGRLLLDGKPQVLEATSRYHNAVQIHLTEPVSGAAQALLQLDYVHEVEEQEDGLQMMAFPENGQMILPALAQYLELQHWPVDNLHVEKGRLDDVFRDVTRGEEIIG